MTWARTILWMVLLASLAGAIYFSMGWYQYKLQLEAWQAEVLLEMPVDVSQIGSIKGSVTLSTRVPCKVQLVLVLDTKQVFDKSVLKPLSGSGTVTESYSPVPLNGFTIHGEFVVPHQGSLNAFVIASLEPWDTEPRKFHIRITKAVSRLEGLQQRLLIKNQLCGMEGMVLFVYFLFASLCIIAALIAVYVLYRMRKSRLIAEVAKASDELR